MFRARSMLTHRRARFVLPAWPYLSLTHPFIRVFNRDDNDFADPMTFQFTGLDLLPEKGVTDAYQFGQFAEPVGAPGGGGLRVLRCDLGCGKSFRDEFDPRRQLLGRLGEFCDCPNYVREGHCDGVVSVLG